MNERDKALLEAIEAVQVAELEDRIDEDIDDIQFGSDDWFESVTYRRGLLKAARIIAELRKEDHANTEEG